MGLKRFVSSIVLLCILHYCSYTVVELTNKPLYTLINVSLKHVKPSQSDPVSNNTKQTERPTGNILPRLNNSTNNKDSQRKNETRTVSSDKSNSSVITLKEKYSNRSSTERWYTVTYQETEHGKNKN